MSDFDKPPKKKVMAAEIRQLWQELIALKERVAGDGPLNPRCSAFEAAVRRLDDAVRDHGKFVSQHNDRLAKLEESGPPGGVTPPAIHAHELRLDSHAAKLAVLENRLDVLATTALHLHENLLNEHDARLKGLEEMALGDRKKAPIKKAPKKGRRT